MYDLAELRQSARSRRAFLKIMTAAGIGAAAAALLDLSPRAMAQAGDPDAAPAVANPANFPASIPGQNINVKVLNFALTLEHLEASLYRQALNSATGRTLPQALGPRNGYRLRRPSGNLTATEARDGMDYLVRFALSEAAHAAFLTTAITGLGGTPVAPNPGGYRFVSPVTLTLQGYFAALLPLEETGVRAYLGAAPFLTDSTLAQVAAGIYSVEARHSAAIRYLLDQDIGPVPMAGDQKVIGTYPSPNTLEYFLTPQQVLNRVTPYIV